MTTIYEKILGKEHSDYATSLNNLGLLYWTIGDYAKAERYYLEAIAIYEKTLGKEHYDYAKSLNNLGILYKDVGNYVKAETCFLEAKSIREKVCGKEHPKYHEIKNITNRYFVTCVVKGYTDKHMELEHIATVKRINLAVDTLMMKEPVQVGENLLAYVVQWGDEWALMGSMVIYRKGETPDINN